MRAYLLPIIGFGAAAVVAVSAFAPVSGAVAAPSHPGASHPARLGTCYAQLDADNGIGIVSQNFEASFNEFDSRGADDFTLTRTCQVKRIDVAGEYINGPGPATSENVTIYRSLHGLPGGVESNQENLVGIDDGTGNLKIPLLTPVGLQAQTYVVSVQINLAFSSGGEWGWSTNNTQRGHSASWRNKGDGFGTGCVHYTALLTCIDSTEGPDFAFAILGS